MAISVGFVDAAHTGPEFMVAYPGSRKGSLFTAVGSIPFVGRHDLCRVGSILQQIICARLAAFDDVLYLCMNQDQRLAEPVQFALVSLSVGSIMSVPATGNETVGA